ncbi:MAG TPA: arginine--tRNA ligase [Candidatus Paceibacterota bacterium]
MKLLAQIKQSIESYLLKTHGIAEDAQLILSDLNHADFQYNGALKFAKQLGVAPLKIAEEIVEQLTQYVQDVEIKAVAPGYVNFIYTQSYIEDALAPLVTGDVKPNIVDKKRIMVEYTDPNTFKVFHIGHLMTNAIGESLARLFEYGGHDVIRANYQGDVGRHIAQAIYGVLNGDIQRPADDAPLKEKTEYLGKCYVYGAQQFEASDDAKAKIREINAHIYNNDNEEINAWNQKGRNWSLERFEELYKILNTKFNYYFFESQTAPIGLEKVKANIPSVFVESDGAIVFKGEEYGLHTRVFINKEGLPTYEAKDVGLAYLKHEKEPKLNISITVTANEQAEYFKVMKKAVECIDLKIASPMMHVYHGMMSGPGGKKMSSRKGDVVTGESLIEDAMERAREVIEEHYKDKKTAAEKDAIAEAVAVAAIKFTILKQDSSKNIMFDLEKALSFEGDSGPYLLYTNARLCSIIRKSSGLMNVLGRMFSAKKSDPVGELERVLMQFPIVAERAVEAMESHRITTYALELSRAINSWYGSHKVIGSGEYEAYRLRVVQAAQQTLKTCIELLGMKAVEEM